MCAQLRLRTRRGLDLGSARLRSGTRRMPRHGYCCASQRHGDYCMFLNARTGIFNGTGVFVQRIAHGTEHKTHKTNRTDTKSTCSTFHLTYLTYLSYRARALAAHRISGGLPPASRGKQKMCRAQASLPSREAPPAKRQTFHLEQIKT